MKRQTLQIPENLDIKYVRFVDEEFEPSGIQHAALHEACHVVIAHKLNVEILWVKSDEGDGVTKYNLWNKQSFKELTLEEKKIVAIVNAVGVAIEKEINRGSCLNRAYGDYDRLLKLLVLIKDRIKMSPQVAVDEFVNRAKCMIEEHFVEIVRFANVLVEKRFMGSDEILRALGE